MMPIRTYSELIKLPTFEERYQYLKLDGKVGYDTFGINRYINQRFYKTDKRWLSIRDKIIIRDNGMDLGVDGYPIMGRIIIHHMNPVTVEDIINDSSDLFNPEFLICVSFATHNAIHYSNDCIIAQNTIERTEFDTCPWKKLSGR